MTFEPTTSPVPDVYLDVANLKESPQRCTGRGGSLGAFIRDAQRKRAPLHDPGPRRARG